MIRGNNIGGIAQLGERLLCKQDVVSSILATSTISERTYIMQTVHGDFVYTVEGSKYVYMKRVGEAYHYYISWTKLH